MAKNAPNLYGETIDCWDDADEFFSTVSGIDSVTQDLYHRLTNDSFLGEGGEDEGIDVTKWAGMDPAKLARRGPMIAEVATRDERIDACDVKITPTKIADTRYTATMKITATTALGPFRRVFAMSDVALVDITDTWTGD